MAESGNESQTSRRSEVAIETVMLAKRFGRHQAVEGLSFSIPRGSVCGFLGPNGAGKTTTLRLLLGLIPPTSGTVRVLGLNPFCHGYELRSRIGFVPDVSNLYKWMTIAEVFEFCAGIFQHWDDEFRKSLAAQLALPEKRLVKHLSRGELAKLNLIIAMAHRPELLILDEPTTGLDPLVRAQFLDSVSTLARQRQTTVLFSTHILGDIDQIADRLLVLFGGRLAANDSIDQLRLRYTKVSILFDTPPTVQQEVPQAIRVTRGVREWIAIFPSSAGVEPELLRSRLGAASASTHTLTIEDIFQELLHPASEAN